MKNEMVNKIKNMVPTHIEIWRRQMFNENTNKQKVSVKNKWPDILLAQENLYLYLLSQCNF